MDAAKTSSQQNNNRSRSRFPVMTVILLLLLTNTPPQAWIYKNIVWKSKCLISLLNTARKFSYQKVIKHCEIERFLTRYSFCNFCFIFIKPILRYQQSLLGVLWNWFSEESKILLRHFGNYTSILSGYTTLVTRWDHH